ncbi:MAG TPA: GntR family transcriptional regulator, partial [Pseudonocardiaceae bacterium]
MFDDNSRSAVIASLRAAAGAATPGTRMPSVRDIQAEHRVSPLTVQRAVAELVAEGLLETRPGAGTFVAAQPITPEAEPDLGWQVVALGRGRGVGDALKELAAVPPPGAIPLSAGYPDATLHATGPIGAALARAARRPEAWDRPPSEGVPR